MVDKKDWLEKTDRLQGAKLHFSGGYVDFGGLWNNIKNLKEVFFGVFYLLPVWTSIICCRPKLKVWGKKH